MSCMTYSGHNMEHNRKIPRAMCPMYEIPLEEEDNLQPYQMNHSQTNLSSLQPPNFNNTISHSVHPSQINRAVQTPVWLHPSQHYEVDPSLYPIPINQQNYPNEVNHYMHTTQTNQYNHPYEMDQYGMPHNQMNWPEHSLDRNHDPRFHTINRPVHPSEMNQPLHTSIPKKSSSTKTTHWHPSTYRMNGAEPTHQNELSDVTCTPRGVEVSDSNTVYQVFDCLTPNDPRKHSSSAKIGKLYLDNGLLQGDPRANRPVGVRIRPRKKFKKKAVHGRRMNPPKYNLPGRNLRDTCSSSSAASVGPPSRHANTLRFSEFSDIGERSEEEDMYYGYPTGSHYNYTQTDGTHSTPRTTQTEANYSSPRTSHTQTENVSNSRKTQTGSMATSSRSHRSESLYPTDRTMIRPSFDGYSLQSSSSSPNRGSHLSFRSKSCKSSRSSRSRGSRDLDCPPFFGDLPPYIPGLFVLGIAVGVAVCFFSKTIERQFYSALSSYC